jgi:hypothetical protein
MTKLIDLVIRIITGNKKKEKVQTKYTFGKRRY